MKFIKEKIENWKQSRMFNAQNCAKKQEELRIREERRKLIEEQHRLDGIITEIENRIHFVISQSFNQQTVIFQVLDGEKDMFEKVKEHFANRGFNAFFQQMENLPVEALVISWYA